MVGLDREGKPTEVPSIKLDSPDDKRRFNEGELRMRTRLQEAGKI
jgi:hypothetical protein